MDYNLDSFPLEIKTNSVLGSDEIMVVYFYQSDGKLILGFLKVYFRTSPLYMLGSCVESWTNFPTTLPTTADKIWRVTVTKSSDIRVEINCNEEQVLNILLSEETCTPDNWRDRWSQAIAKIGFSSSDTASDYYRPGDQSKFKRAGGIDLTDHGN